MSMIFLTIGNAYMGSRKTDAEGNVTQIPARFEEDPDGGCVAIGKLNSDTMEQDGLASIFGDYDAAHYLAHALELLKPGRPINIPDLKSIVQKATRAGDGDFICEHCNGVNCRDCIIIEWKEEENDE